MKIKLYRPIAIASARNNVVRLLVLLPVPLPKADRITLRLATSGSETDQRSVAMAEVFAPMVASFADYQPGYNGTLFAQGTELEAISRGNLEMSIASAQGTRPVLFRSFQSLPPATYIRTPLTRVRVFNSSLMDPFKQKVEDELGVKLLSVMYLGRAAGEPASVQGRIDCEYAGGFGRSKSANARY